MKRILFILVMSSLLYGCSTIPNNPNGKSVVIMPIEHNKEEINIYYLYYRLYFSENNFIYLEPRNQYSITNNMEPGDYELSALEPVNIKSKDKYKQTSIGVKFSCKQNSITILKESLYVYFKKNNGKLQQQVEIRMMDDKKYEEFVANIKRSNNLENWEIITQ